MLSQKNALITGSTSGIGLGIARSLAAQGCNIILNGLGDAGEIEQIRKNLDDQSSGRVLFHGADLSDTNQIEAMMNFAATNMGGVDILINNAGIQHVAPIEKFPTEKWDAIIAINLSSTFHTMRLAIPAMQNKNWGRIINIASVHGLVGSSQKAAYVAAKHGVIGLTKVTALETAESGITVNSICPGWVRTELVEKQIDLRAGSLGVDTEEAARNLLSEKQPSKQFVTPKQLGETALYLCSENAAQMTGSTLTLDGGWTAQ